MIEPIVAFTLLDKVLTGLGLLREGKKERTAKADRALMALYSALSKTKKYISEENAGGTRNRDMEWKLAELWHNASIPLREIDPELAEKCFLKEAIGLSRKHGPKNELPKRISLLTPSTPSSRLPVHCCSNSSTLRSTGTPKQPASPPVWPPVTFDVMPTS